jgi:hypothetical protein
MRFSGPGRNSGIGYSAALNVFLAYSALEACRQATRRSPARTAVIDPPLADELRMASKGIRVKMREFIACARRKDRFARFCAGGSDDVVGFAAAIAHVVANGALASWGPEALTIGAATVYDKLARTLLARSDQLLGDHCVALRGHQARKKLNRVRVAGVRAQNRRSISGSRKPTTARDLLRTAS